jgi:predicted metal-binding protein
MGTFPSVSPLFIIRFFMHIFHWNSLFCLQLLNNWLALRYNQLVVWDGFVFFLVESPTLLFFIFYVWDWTLCFCTLHMGMSHCHTSICTQMVVSFSHCSYMYQIRSATCIYCVNLFYRSMYVFNTSIVCDVNIASFLYIVLCHTCTSYLWIVYHLLSVWKAVYVSVCMYILRLSCPFYQAMKMTKLEVKELFVRFIFTIPIFLPVVFHYPCV